MFVYTIGDIIGLILWSIVVIVFIFKLLIKSAINKAQDINHKYKGLDDEEQRKV